MAAEERQGILKFEVDQQDGISQLEHLKKSIISLKEEQNTLNKAYKSGAITQGEFAKETVRVETILKTHQGTYNNLQKSITGHKNSLDKLNDRLKTMSLGGFANQAKDAASQMNIAGVNVGQFTAKIAALANPVTLAVGLLGALGTAYAQSTIGAKDLEFAHNQLATATKLVTNQFAALISSAEDGEGAFTKLLNSSLQFIGNSSFGFGLKLLGVDLNKVADKSRELTKAQEELQDLQREEINIRATANDRLAENQELLTKIQSDQTSYVQKLELSEKIIENIGKNELDLTNNKAAQLGIVEKSLKADEHNETLQKQRNLLNKELSAIQKEATKRQETQNKLADNLKDTEFKRLQIIREINDAVNKDTDLTSGLKSKDVSGATGFEKKKDSAIKEGSLAIVDSAKVAARAMASIEKGITKNKSQESKKRVGIQMDEDQARVQSAGIVLHALTGLADEGSDAQKAFALLAITADTAVAVTKGIAASQSVPYPGNLIAMATTIATVLANIAQAKSIAGFAEGGWTGYGDKYEPAGIVHKDEYVVKKSIVNSSWAQPHLAALESGRIRGYSDGGLVTNSIVNPINTQMMIANAMKSIEGRTIAVRDIRAGLKNVNIKDQRSKVR